MTRTFIVDGNAPAWAHDLVRQLSQAFGGRTVPLYAVSTLPAARPMGQVVFVSDDVGGPVLAFSDGSAWRRSTDRAVVVSA